MKVKKVIILAFINFFRVHSRFSRKSFFVNPNVCAFVRLFELIIQYPIEFVIAVENQLVSTQTNKHKDKYVRHFVAREKERYCRENKEWKKRFGIYFIAVKLLKVCQRCIWLWFLSNCLKYKKTKRQIMSLFLRSRRKTWLVYFLNDGFCIECWKR